MNLGNPFEIVVYNFLIEEMIGLNHQDRFPMVSAPVCMVTN